MASEEINTRQNRDRRFSRQTTDAFSVTSGRQWDFTRRADIPRTICTTRLKRSTGMTASFHASDMFQPVTTGTAVITCTSVKKTIAAEPYITRDVELNLGGVETRRQNEKRRSRFLTQQVRRIAKNSKGKIRFGLQVSSNSGDSFELNSGHVLVNLCGLLNLCEKKKAPMITIFSVSCMFDLSGTDGVMDVAVRKAAERSGVGFLTGAGDRSYVPGSFKTVTEQDRRRSVETSPISRQSRRRPHADSSSHLQDKDFSLDGSITSFVGIDVSKHSLDLCILPQETRQNFSYDTKRLKQLFRLLPDPGTCLIVVEAAGGSLCSGTFMRLE